MPVKSVGFAIGNLRARENRMLKKSDMLRLAAASDTDELAAALSDCGIDKKDGAEIPEMLSAETEKLWKYLTDNAPDMSLFEPFIYENDFHNFKAVLKGTVRNRDYGRLLITPASVDVVLLERAVKEKRFDLLPEFMKKPAAEAYDILIKTGDSQLADCVIDAGQMTARLKKAKELDNPLVLRLVTVSVFYSNIKAALRAARAGKGRQFLETVLTDTGVCDKAKMVSAALEGEEKLLELLSSKPETGGDKAAECYRENPWKFEKFADDFLTASAGRCRYITIGAEPLVGYMIAKKTEIKNLGIIYSGVKTGQPSEKIIERLRELYG